MTDQFEHDLRRAIAMLPSPEPQDALLARILEDRKAGARTNTVSRRRPNRLLIGAGLAAAAALALWMTSAKDGPTTPTWLWPEALYAQGGPSAAFSPVPPRNGSQLRPGVWIYSAQTLDDDDRVVKEHHFTLTILQGAFRDSAAWVIARQRRSVDPVLVDTTWMSRDSLHPLARFSPLLYGASLSTSYLGDSLVIDWKKYSGETQHLAARLPEPRLWRNAAVLTGNEILALFLTTPLDADWQGSYAGTTLNNSGELLTFWWDLKVIGEAQVQVPAGRFSCWKVTSKWGDHLGVTYWVDKTTGWVVQESFESTPSYRRVLLSQAAE